MAKKLVGVVTHFYPKISVAVVEVKDTIKKGDKVSIIRGEENLNQIVSSMQIDYKPIEEAKKGQIIGMKVNAEVKEGAQIFKETAEAKKAVAKKAKSKTKKILKKAKSTKKAKKKKR